MNNDNIMSNTNTACTSIAYSKQAEMQLTYSCRSSARWQCFESK